MTTWHYESSGTGPRIRLDAKHRASLTGARGAGVSHWFTGTLVPGSSISHRRSNISTRPMLAGSVDISGHKGVIVV